MAVRASLDRDDTLSLPLEAQPLANVDSRAEQYTSSTGTLV